MSFSLQNTRYDHPTFTVMRTEGRPIQVSAVAVQKTASFRSKLKAIVTNVSVMLVSAATGTVILTLLANGSVAAVLTLDATANQHVSDFTLTTNRTLDTLTDRLDVSVVTHDTGKLHVLYQYKIVPQDITCFGTNLI